MASEVSLIQSTVVNVMPAMACRRLSMGNSAR